MSVQSTHGCWVSAVVVDDFASCPKKSIKARLFPALLLALDKPKVITENPGPGRHASRGAEMPSLTSC